jgi:hypothetical protein
LMPIPIPFFPFPFRESVPSCVLYIQGGPRARTVSPDESGQALWEWKRTMPLQTNNYQLLAIGQNVKYQLINFK